MLTAVVRSGKDDDGDHRGVYCGRPGCHGGPFGKLRSLGHLSDGEAWEMDLSERWLLWYDLQPPRWRRGKHLRHGFRKSGVDRTLNMRLPTVLECPRCRAVQRVDRPR